MYICICNSITEKQLEYEINKNANISVKDICSKLNIGTSCGTCIENVIRHKIEKRRLEKEKAVLTNGSEKNERMY